MFSVGVSCLFSFAIVTALNSYNLVRVAQGRNARGSPIVFFDSILLAVGLKNIGVVDAGWATAIGFLHCVADLSLLLFFEHFTVRFVQWALSLRRGK